MTAHHNLCQLCAERLTDRQAGQLVGWLAWRLERPAALAGQGDNRQRLAHIAEHWLSADRCLRLECWIADRLERGLPPVPD